MTLQRRSQAASMTHVTSAGWKKTTDTSVASCARWKPKASPAKPLPSWTTPLNSGAKWTFGVCCVTPVTSYNVAILDYTENDIPALIKERNAMYYRGADKFGHPIRNTIYAINQAIDGKLLTTICPFSIRQREGKHCFKWRRAARTEEIHRVQVWRTSSQPLRANVHRAVRYVRCWPWQLGTYFWTFFAFNHIAVLCVESRHHKVYHPVLYQLFPRLFGLFGKLRHARTVSR